MFIALQHKIKVKHVHESMYVQDNIYLFKVLC